MMFKIVSTGLVMAVLSLAIGPATTVAAVEKTISISPLRNEIIVDPGQVRSGVLTLTNSSEEEISLTLRAESFSVINQQYDYEFNSVKPEVAWVSFDDPILKIPRQSKKDISYAITVPLTAEPGGYYMSLFATVVPSNSQDSIVPVESIGSLVYIAVSGELTKYGEVLNLSSPALVFNDTTWSASVNNLGNVHFRSQFSATVQNILGEDILEQDDTALILPNSVRLLQPALPVPELSGLYKVRYNISLGDGQPYSTERWFLVAHPVQVLLVIVIFWLLVLLLPKRKR